MSSCKSRLHGFRNGPSFSFGLEISLALLVKFLLLGGLWWVFFAGKKPPINEEIMAGRMFGEKSPVAVASPAGRERNDRQ